jgi:hypothetical protein
VDDRCFVQIELPTFRLLYQRPNERMDKLTLTGRDVYEFGVKAFEGGKP